MGGRLREQAADQGGFGDAADSQDHGAGARRNVMFAHGFHHFVEGSGHDLLQAQIHFVGVPHQAFLVLHPFEVADRHAAGVGQNVRQHGDAAAGENLVGVRGGGAVGGFRDDAGLDGLGVVQGNDVFKRRGNQNV